MGYESLGRALRHRGHSLEIVGPADLGATRHHPRLLPLILPVLVRRWLARHPGFDVVIFHSYAGWLCPRATPSVVDFHGFEPLYHAAHEAEAARAGRPLSFRYRATYGTLVPWMLRRSCGHARLVTCLNSAERDAIVGGGYAPADRVWLRHFGAPPLYPAAHVYRARATVLVGVMQWLLTKGTRYLIDAFTTLTRRHADLRLHLAGTLREEDEVRAAFPPDVRSRVTVRPVFARGDLAAIFGEADIFVHASVYEGIGLAILDAMASGIPVVTTRTGVAIDHLDDGREGVIVPIGDAHALAGAIEPLLDDRQRREALGTAGRRRAEGLREDDANAEFAARLERIAESA